MHYVSGKSFKLIMLKCIKLNDHPITNGSHLMIKPSSNWILDSPPTLVPWEPQGLKQMKPSCSPKVSGPFLRNLRKNENQILWGWNQIFGFGKTNKIVVLSLHFFPHPCRDWLEKSHLSQYHRGPNSLHCQHLQCIDGSFQWTSVTSISGAQKLVWFPDFWWKKMA